MKPLKPLESLLAENYGLEGGEFKELKTGSFNKLWMFNCNNRQYIIKQINHAYTKQLIGWYTKILNKVRGNTIPLNLIPNRNNEYLTAYVDEFWSVMEYVDGEVFQHGNRTQLFEAARIIKQLNEIDIVGIPPLQQSEAENNKKNEINPWLGNYEYEINRLNQLLISQSILDTTYINSMNAIFTDPVNILHGDDYESFPLVISHGEYQNHNLIYNDNQLVCVIDWDAVSLRPRIYDISVSAVFLCRQSRGKFDLDASAFVDYLDRFSLTDKEIKCILPIVLLYFVPKIHYIEKFKKYAPQKLTWYLEWSIDAMETLYSQLKELTR